MTLNGRLVSDQSAITDSACNGNAAMSVVLDLLVIEFALSIAWCPARDLPIAKLR